MRTKAAASQTTLITQPDAVDLIRFEKNLLQIGFFGAHERRGKEQTSSRRIEQWVNREGKKVLVSAEFRSSEVLGLPSTADRDKYMGFMKLLMEMKLRNGLIANPIRFSGYSLLKVLGQCDSGENYEALNNWGKRMADTTITSEQVIYSSVRKRYMNKTVHVFRSFTRLGSSNLDNSDKVDTFEVELEDWLLENLNESFVVPEDFNMYRKLVRPTAKGIFVYLYLWFFASQGKEVEKDYSELCALLNVRTYEHVSKIRETMGLSLQDLVDIGYLKSWDIRPMSSKKGYKLVLAPGPSMREVLLLTQRKQLAFDSGRLDLPLSESCKQAKATLTEWGVSPMKASELVKRFEPSMILDQTEYVAHQMLNDKRRSIANPPGYLISFIEGQQPIPRGFKTKRQRQEDAKALKAQESIQTAENIRSFAESRRRHEYAEWTDRAAEAAIGERFTSAALEKRLSEISTQLRSDRQLAQALDCMTADVRRTQLLRKLKRIVASELELPSFEEWSIAHPQAGLFD